MRRGLRSKKGLSPPESARSWMAATRLSARSRTPPGTTSPAVASPELTYLKLHCKRKKPCPVAPGMASFSAGCASLDPAEQNQDQQNDYDNADQTRRAVAPAAAVRPGRNDAQKDQDQDDEKNGTE